MAETNTTSQKLRKIKVVFWYSGPLPGVCVSFVVGRGGAGPCFALFLPPPLLSVSDFFLPRVPRSEGRARSVPWVALLRSMCPLGAVLTCALFLRVCLVAGWKSSNPTRISALHSSLTQVTKTRSRQLLVLASTPRYIFFLPGSQ